VAKKKPGSKKPTKSKSRAGSAAGASKPKAKAKAKPQRPSVKSAKAAKASKPTSKVNKKSAPSAKAAASKPAPAKGKTKPTAAVPTAKPAGRDAAKPTKSGGKDGKSATGGKKGAAPTPLKPDAQGYVVINGRRVRMISTKGLNIPKRSAQSAAAAQQADAQLVPAKIRKSRLNKKDLDHFRELLLLHRRQLAGDLTAMESEALNSGGGNGSHMPIHMADIGTDTFDQDFMLGLAANERVLLKEIDAALARIESGEYGVCAATGQPIPKSRLNAKPWAKYTVEAARRIERGLNAG